MPRPRRKLAQAAQSRMRVKLESYPSRSTPYWTSLAVVAFLVGSSRESEATRWRSTNQDHSREADHQYNDQEREQNCEHIHGGRLLTVRQAFALDREVAQLVGVTFAACC